MANALSTIQAARQTLAQLEPQMKMILPPSITPERMSRVIMSALQSTPALLNCDRTSFMKAAMTVSYLGLEPEGVLGQAYLVPYKGQVQAQIGYKGLITLARNSGLVSSLAAHEVCEGDEFDYAFGLEPKLQHVPAKSDRGAVTHFYAVAKFKDGSHHFEVMSKAEVDKIRDGSPSKNGPWASHYVEMGKKTAIRRISKYLPLTIQRAEALNVAAEQGKVASIDDGMVIENDAIQTPEESVEGAPKLSKLDSFEDGLTIDNDEGRDALGLKPLKEAEIFSLASPEGEIIDFTDRTKFINAYEKELKLVFPQDRERFVADNAGVLARAKELVPA